MLRRAVRHLFIRAAPKSLRQAVVWMMASVMVPLALGGAVLVFAQWRSAQQAAADELALVASNVAHVVDLHLARGRAHLEAIAALPGFDQLDYVLVHRYASGIAASHPSASIGLIRADGQVVLSTAAALGAELPNVLTSEAQGRTTVWQGVQLPLTSQGLVREALRGGTITYSNLYFNPVIGQPVMAVAMPVRRGEAADHVLLFTFPTADLARLLNSAALPPSAEVTLVDRQSRVVASTGEGTRTGTPVTLPALDVEISRILTERDAGGTLLAAAYSRSASGLAVRVSLPASAIFRQAKSAAMSWTLLLLAALFISGVAAARLSRAFSRPLERLAASAQRGGFDYRGATGLAEVDELAAALRRGAHTEHLRQQAQLGRVAAEQKEQAIRAIEARIRRVFDGLHVFVAVLRSDGTVIEANHPPLRGAGLRRAEVVGRALWESYWWRHHPHLQQFIRDAFAQALDGQVVRHDVPVQLAAGRMAMLDLQFSPLKSDDGSVDQVIVCAVDVEDRMEALRSLDEQRWLLDAALKATPAGIVVSDATAGALRVNLAHSRLWGLPALSLTQRPWRGWWAQGEEHAGEPLAPSDWPLSRALAHARDETSMVDIEPFDAPGTRKTVLMSASPVLDEEGQVVGGVLVQTDITDRMHAEQALREADRNKDAFLATLGHELRNPLAPIRTAVEILRRKQAGDPTVERARQIIERQAAHMSRLVDDLLDVSRITRGLVRIRMEPVRLAEVIATAVESSLPAIEAAGVALVQDVPAQPCHALGDPTRLAQAVSNLLNNACKFTPRGGRIELSVHCAGQQQAEITVRDTGIGLAPDSLERIFGLFTQEQPSGANGNTGLGIGLALARQLVRLHGGELTAASEGHGHGSTFTIRLPACILPVPQEPDACAPAAEDAGSERPVVLVVDDNHDACDSLCELLQLGGLEAWPAYDGEEALAVLDRSMPGVVVLDIGLPGLDGYEVCRRIRARAGPQPVLVALTGWGQPQDRQAALDAGFDAHCTKPTDPIALGRMVEQLWRVREQVPGQMSAADSSVDALT
jgi:PAS domain S-box-containing protein